MTLRNTLDKSNCELDIKDTFADILVQKVHFQKVLFATSGANGEHSYAQSTLISYFQFMTVGDSLWGHLGIDRQYKYERYPLIFSARLMFTNVKW